MKVVVQQPLVSSVPGALFSHEISQALEGLVARGRDEHARVEGIGPSDVGGGGEAVRDGEEGRQGPEDEGIGVEVDDLFILRQAKDVQLGEGRCEVLPACERGQGWEGEGWDGRRESGSAPSLAHRTPRPSPQQQL